MADRHNSERLAESKVDAYIKRARSAFNRSSSYKAGQHLATDFAGLDLYTSEEQLEAVRKCLWEIDPSCFTRPHSPNHIGCEPVCRGERLLQFTWISESLGRKMCFKLAIDTRRQSDERLIVVRLHPAYDPNRFTKMDIRAGAGEEK